MTSQTVAPVSARALEPLFHPSGADDRSSHAHRQLIGILGLVLPGLLWLMAVWRPTEALPRLQPLSSVSAYYYTGAVAAFVGILIALAVFLFTYRGYDNVHGRRDRVAAVVAGGAAVVVALFPTAAPAGLSAPSWWTLRTGTIHYASAVVLFGAFIYFSLFLFPKSNVRDGASLPGDKRVRNRIYIVCGGAMVACILWAGGALYAGRPIFWPEALALEFFAVSWLVKGRADRTAVTAVARALHYGRHPSQLVGRLSGPTRG